MRHQPDKFTEAEYPGENLKNTHEDDGREQILDAVLRHQRHHHHRKRARCTRNHAGTTAEQRGDETNDKRGIETNKRMHARNKRKGDCLGDKSKRNRQAGENLGAYFAGTERLRLFES